MREGLPCVVVPRLRKDDVARRDGRRRQVGPFKGKIYIEGKNKEEEEGERRKEEPSAGNEMQREVTQ